MDNFTETPELAAFQPYVVLNDVRSITATNEAEVYTVVASFTVGGVQMEGPFGLRPEDDGDLATAIRQWMADHAGSFTIQPYVPPPPAPYALSIEALWMRMEDAEADAFDAAMATATPIRLRRAFQSASSLTSGTELFSFAKQVFTSSVSQSRATAVFAQA